ncbi:arginase family protein [Wenyingzhuangia sp. IMCC45574]
MTTNYAGISEEYAKKETANIVIVPVSYHQTSTNNTGIEAFLEASANMELYDIETDSQVYKKGIYLAQDVVENTSAQAMVQAVSNQVKSYLNTNKFVTVVANQRSSSIGTIKAFYDHFENLTVLQLDAHANLHKEFKGEKVNNQCSMYHASQATNLIQVGIRSMAAIEKTVLDQDKVFFAHEMAADDYWMENAIEALTDNVLISLDLDSLDPSIMPSVDQPEQGGLFWYETLEFLQKVFQEKNVVGFDMVGLAPIETNKAPNALAARLFYKMLSYKYEQDYDDTEIDENSFTTKENKIGKFNDQDL